MQGCTIQKGASIQYTILDKDVTIKSGTKLLGSPEHPLIIRKGVTVGESQLPLPKPLRISRPAVLAT